ncbi:MAG TPA: hypothetical protein VFO60_07345, partial [Candidatus Dormibacteraeota bacterium]|nr:hypothetical protein [Candidatus Dormibacteraeota bacterium]
MADERGTDQLPDATPAQPFVTPAGEPDWAGLAALHPVALVTELMRIADARMSGRTGADEDAAAAALPAPVRL